MTIATQGVPLSTLSKLLDIRESQIADIVVMNDDAWRATPPSILLPLRNAQLELLKLFEFKIALAIACALTLSRAEGLPLREALRVVSYTGAIERYPGGAQQFGKAAEDFWAAMVSLYDVQDGFRTMHACGTFASVTHEISAWLREDEKYFPDDSEPARMVFCNVSAADRRLRKRAEQLDIKIGGCEFVAS